MLGASCPCHSSQLRQETRGAGNRRRPSESFGDCLGFASSVRTASNTAASIPSASLNAAVSHTANLVDFMPIFELRLTFIETQHKVYHH